ncbi:histidine phosphatase family protein [Xenorhabdus bovienii]|uniref:histidine phosphatase family protein n=1 Tax=Xenorhabdus bovienii TaxID=40576 RepID=UPI0030B93276
MIYLMRHGITSYNLTGRMLGQTDLPLCEIGIKNVMNIAPKMNHFGIKLIYCSSYIRSIQTASIISSFTGANVSKRENLKERHLGVLDGEFKDTTRWRDVVNKLGEKNFTPEGGESVDNCLERFTREMKSIVNSNLDEENVLVVSHGGVINLFIRYVLHVNNKLSFLDNGDFHILDTDRKGNFHVNKLNVSLI